MRGIFINICKLYYTAAQVDVCIKPDNVINEYIVCYENRQQETEANRPGRVEFNTCNCNQGELLRWSQIVVPFFPPHSLVTKGDRFEEF